MLHWTAQLQDFPRIQKIHAFFALLIGFLKALPVIPLKSGGLNKFSVQSIHRMWKKQHKQKN